jgi:hypothetical protein
MPICSDCRIRRNWPRPDDLLAIERLNVERITNEGPPQTPRSPPAAEDSALAALRAQVEALAHELEVLRHDHHQLYTYHHHLRFRLAERANLWLRGLPLLHRMLGRSYLTAQSIRRCFRRRS